MGHQQQPLLPEMISELQSWFDSELGQALLDAEMAMVEQIVPTLFGYRLVQLGVDSRAVLFAESYVQQKYLIAPKLELGLTGNSVIASNTELPLEQHSIDVVILHHALDFTESPHQVLREAARVLRPGGHMLLISFNPLSMWGLYRKFLRRRRGQVPWCGHFVSHRRLSDWFKLLELTELKQQSDCFVAPFVNQKWRQRSRHLGKLLQNAPAEFGAFNLMLARKDVVGMTPLKPEWSRRHLITLPIAKPTARGHSREGR